MDRMQNLSLEKNDLNCFYDSKTENKLSNDALKFIAGVMKHAKSIVL